MYKKIKLNDKYMLQYSFQINNKYLYLIKSPKYLRVEKSWKIKNIFDELSVYLEILGKIEYENIHSN